MNDREQIEMLMVDIYMSGYGLDWADSEGMAEQLNFLDYRKIPEGSVVISKEEYNALLLEQKRLREMVDRIPCGYELKDDARKEAIKDFIQTIKKDVNITYYDDEVTTFAYVDIDDIYYIAIDKFGVAI